MANTIHSNLTALATDPVHSESRGSHLAGGHVGSDMQPYGASVPLPSTVQNYLLPSATLDIYDRSWCVRTKDGLEHESEPMAAGSG